MNFNFEVSSEADCICTLITKSVIVDIVLKPITCYSIAHKV